MEYEGDDNRSSWNSTKVVKELKIRRSIKDFPHHSIVEFGKNTEKSPEELIQTNNLPLMFL